MAKRHIIHVNQHVIKKNRARLRAHEDFMTMPMRDMMMLSDRELTQAIRKPVKMDPVLTVKGEGQNQYGHTAEIWFRGELVGEFVYRPYEPLSCGAHVWFQTETDEDLEVVVK